MGVWMIGTGSISIKPQADETLIKEYMQFSRECFPEEYGEENFSNTWFFDEKNELFSIAGKFAEPSIWYRHIKENFFEARGYELEGWTARKFCVREIMTRNTMKYYLRRFVTLWRLR